MTPIIDLFVPVFLVMVGVSINLRVIDMSSGAFWSFAGVLTVVAVLSKMVSGVWAQGGFREKLSTGIAMVPRGEVGFYLRRWGRGTKYLTMRPMPAWSSSWRLRHCSRLLPCVI